MPFAIDQHFGHKKIQHTKMKFGSSCLFPSLLRLPGLPDMQIPGRVLASRQIILLGTINSVVLLNVNSIPQKHSKLHLATRPTNALVNTIQRAGIGVGTQQTKSLTTSPGVNRIKKINSSASQMEVVCVYIAVNVIMYYYYLSC